MKYIILSTFLYLQFFTFLTPTQCQAQSVFPTPLPSSEAIPILFTPEVPLATIYLNSNEASYRSSASAVAEAEAKLLQTILKIVQIDEKHLYSLETREEKIALAKSIEQKIESLSTFNKNLLIGRLRELMEKSNDFTGHAKAVYDKIKVSFGNQSMALLSGNAERGVVAQAKFLADYGASLSHGGVAKDAANALIKFENEKASRLITSILFSRQDPIKLADMVKSSIEDIKSLEKNGISTTLSQLRIITRKLGSPSAATTLFENAGKMVRKTAGAGGSALTKALVFAVSAAGVIVSANASEVSPSERAEIQAAATDGDFGTKAKFRNPTANRNGGTQ